MQNKYENKNCRMHETKISKLITQMLKTAPSLAPNPQLRYIEREREREKGLS
jgi:hypothetical protein